MRNIRLTIAYDGTCYAGWQIQSQKSEVTGRRPQVKTIQEIIEKTLQKILQEEVKVIGSGRTDAGVHALAQVANFKTRSLLPLAVIQKALNSILPKDISINSVCLADKDFNACRWAKSKVYRYIILNGSLSSVFLYRYSWHIPFNLNSAAMRQEAKTLAGRHDFKSFCASGSNAKTRIRTIKRIAISVIARSDSDEAISRKDCFAPLGLAMTLKESFNDSKLIAINIEANGFLYNMARNIVGTLVEIGRGRLGALSMDKILLAKDRRTAGSTAPARGLFFVKVKY